jgi:hypothetical protein
MKELVNQYLLIFPKYQMDGKKIKCPLEWWRKHEAMVPTIDYWLNKYWGLLVFKLKLKKYFILLAY